MTTIRRIQDADVQGKRVLVRVDFNVPMKDGQVSDATRLESALPTIDHLVERGAKVILMAHFGRPKGQRRAEMSLEPVCQPLADLMGVELSFVDDVAGEDAVAAVAGMADGDVLLLQNTRFEAGEADFAPFALDDLTRIEVARGEHSALWGADAIGGVISLTTRRAGEEPAYGLRVEGGSYDSRRLTGYVASGEGRVSGSL